MKQILNKVLLFLICAVVTFSFSGCNNSFYYTYEELSAQAEKVEIVEIKNFSSSSCEIIVIKELDEEEKEQLLYDLSKIKFHFSAVFTSPMYPHGTCVRIYCQKEVMFVCAQGTRGLGKSSACCDKTEFNNLISPYL